MHSTSPHTHTMNTKIIAVLMASILICSCGESENEKKRRLNEERIEELEHANHQLKTYRNEETLRAAGAAYDSRGYDTVNHGLNALEAQKAIDRNEQEQRSLRFQNAYDECVERNNPMNRFKF